MRRWSSRRKKEWIGTPPKATDSEEVAEWRKRMGTLEAKEIYKERAATAECVDARPAIAACNSSWF